MRRIRVVSGYFVRSLFRSLAGVGLVLATLAFWLVFFNPQQGTPEVTYYVLVIGIFGAVISFIATLLLAARANQAELLPWVARLPSRVEYMTAVLLSGILVTLILQFLLAALALFRGPELTVWQFIEIPPVWFSLILLAAVLALHATDLVAAGWSRVYVFGILAILLFAQGIRNATLTQLITRINQFAVAQGWTAVNQSLADYAVALNNSDSNILERFFGLIFWPFHAIAEAIIAGHFTTVQALAPAILILYATLLFMLAADLFANKDLMFME